MSLVKWLRKNNSKVMAVVVIVIMFGFVGGSYLSYLTRSGPSPRDTVATYLDGEKITRLDLQAANQELDILTRLRADAWLAAQDMQGLLLGELLFAGRSDRVGSPEVVEYIRQTVNRNKYAIGDKDIAGMYERSGVPSTIYWLLLKAEAHRAGIRIRKADAGQYLAEIIPQAYQNQLTYRSLIGVLIRGGISEDRILETFGDLVAVLQYAHLICSNENVTTSQVRHLASRQNETIDVDFVRIGAEFFTKSQPEPNEEELVAHFSKYKTNEPLSVTEDNPYGFGYKLPDRLRLEYIAVDLDDIAKIVKAPTHEETEGFYEKRKDLFTESVSSDPNDPNAPKINKTRSYAEVVDIITEQMLHDKINSKAKAMLEQAKTLTEPNLPEADQDRAKLASEQFKKNAREYGPVVEQLSKEHNVNIYTGRTGLLSPTELQTDKYLRRMSIEGYGYGPVSITQVVFAIDELGASQLGPFTAPTPRMYENIGPFEDPYSARMRFGGSRRLMVVVRIVEAVKGAAPTSIDETFATHSLVLDPNEDQTEDDVFSVRKKAAEDVKKLAAFGAAGAKAKEFTDLAAKTDWQTTIDRFNQLYGDQAKDDPNDPNMFVLDYLTAISRTSSLQLETLAAQTGSNPLAKYLLNEARVETQFTDKLYSLVPPDANTPKELPTVVEFKPNMSYYCIKDLGVKKLWKEDFDRTRPVNFYREDLTQFQSLAPVHLNPANILKRMRFKFVEEDKKSGEAEQPATSEPEAAT